MSPHNTYIIRVLEYDFDQDGVDYVPTARELKFLFGPFVVTANTEEEAIGKVSDRTGWAIKNCVFEEE